MDEKYVMIPLKAFQEIHGTILEIKEMLLCKKNEANPKTENKTLYTSKEVIEILNISSSTFYRRIKKKDILSSIKGKIIYVKRVDLDHYMNIPR